MTTRTWFSITEASSYLGVHPSTLRRWADGDQIPFTRTRGGHRRFSLEVLQTLRAERGRLKRTGGFGRGWSEAASSGARRELGASSAWGGDLDEDARQRFRDLGRELLDLTIFEIDAGGKKATIDAAGKIGARYSGLGWRYQLSLYDLTEAVLLAHSTLNEAAFGIPAVEQLQRSAVQAVLDAIQRIMQAVQLGMVADYTTRSLALNGRREEGEA